jgi:hypothetical protein
MIWSGDLGTARVRNGLNRIAAITAEQGIKSSEEVKKHKGELEKQIKVNVEHGEGAGGATPSAWRQGRGEEAHLYRRAALRGRCLRRA